MAPPDKYLLPPISDLQSMSVEKIKIIADLADADSRRSHNYPMFGTACGTISFFGCLGTCAYLVTQHHEAAAGLVLGTTVLAVIGRMIRGK